MEEQRFDREFQLWRYGVSHSQLLLMSHKSDTQATRLMLLFKGVEEISLPCEFYCTQLTSEKIGYRTKYIFRTHDKFHHVIALSIFKEEDKLGQAAPSKLIDSFSSGELASRGK